MPLTYRYRKLAAEFRAKARQEERPGLRFDLDRLARSYLRLAEQAEKNERNDVAYETPPAWQDDDIPIAPR